MGLLERILFWIAIIILLIAVVGEKSKISALEEQVEKAKTINVIYEGEGDEEEDEGEDEEEDEGEDEDSEEEEENEEDTEESEGGEE